MGCYESVLIHCPKCKAKQYAQSKSGPCEYGYYSSIEETPEDVLQDINRHAPFHCNDCGAIFEVDLEKKKTVECEDRPQIDYCGVNDILKQLGIKDA